MDTTLVLNTDLQPLSITPLSTMRWQEAITRSWDGSVSVIEVYKNIVKRSPSISIELPSVVMLNTYQHNKRTVRYSRHNVFLRDLFTCQYCGVSFHDRTQELTIDHYIPRAIGGKTEWNNSVTACHRCNTSKSHHLHIHPIHKPYKPDIWDLIKKRKSLPIRVCDESWIPYIGWTDEKLVYVENKENKF
jgi:5-methylcytosine-specific restriction endonuclease McrA